MQLVGWSQRKRGVGFCAVTIALAKFANYLTGKIVIISQTKGSLLLMSR
jgi:hypothetical protein